MNKLFKKIDRIRGSGTAMLDLRPDSPYFHLDGQVFAVHSIGTPGAQMPVGADHRMQTGRIFN